VDEAIRALELHAAVEESVFYPAVRKDSPDAQDKLDESREEHHIVKLLIAELREMSVGDERYAGKFRVLAENVKHHIKQEEAELFARARTGKLDLIALGKQLEQAKASWRPMSYERPGKARRKSQQSGRDKEIRSRRSNRRPVSKAARRTSR
jgi:hypothetical protein